MCGCAQYACSVLGGQKRALDSLKQELQTCQLPGGCWVLNSGPLEGHERPVRPPHPCLFCVWMFLLHVCVHCVRVAVMTLNELLYDLQIPSPEPVMDCHSSLQEHQLERRPASETTLLGWSQEDEQTCSALWSWGWLPGVSKTVPQ